VNTHIGGMSDEKLYYHLRRILDAGPAILILQSGRSYQAGRLTWGEDEFGYYAELPASELLNSEGIDIDWDLEWARLPDIVRVVDAVTGDELYLQSNT
jgi:hypothetical protein